MNSNQFLDQVRKVHAIPSDRKLAAYLEIPQGTIAGIRAKRRHLTDLEAFKVATALDLPNGYVMCEIQAARAKDPKVKKLWSVMATQFSRMADFAKKGNAAGLALLAVWTLCTAPATEASPSLASADSDSRAVYIMLSSGNPAAAEIPDQPRWWPSGIFERY